MKNVEDRDYYTTAEVADICDVDAATVYRWAKNGIIKAHRVGTWWRIKKVDLDKYLKEKGL